jgi:RNA polymerase subunit RPABC4/transcription elongation factor Spt4
MSEPRKVKCKVCGLSVHAQIIDGFVMMFNPETRQPHEHPGIPLTADNDRCPICGARGDMTRHLCKR